MKQVVFSPRAARDLADAWEYAATHDHTTADRLIHRIETATLLLAEMPGIGHRRRDVADARYRYWPVRPYIIAYRIDGARLIVVRIMHERRDLRCL